MLASACSTFLPPTATTDPVQRKISASRAARIDTVVAVTSILGGTGMWIATEHTHHDITLGAVEAAIGGALITAGVVFAASAIYGFTQ